MASNVPLAAIFGCAGPELSGEEQDFFAAANPLGFILFERNCVEPRQVRELIESLRECVARQDAPILIDQEGGRVQRLKPPHWRETPAASVFADVASRDREAGEEAAWLNARLIADDLTSIGISVNCAPVLDVPQPASNPLIGDRALGRDPSSVAALGHAVCEGLSVGGIVSVIKHLPGHGRATADSHEALPTVDTPYPELDATDFVPFRELADRPWGMTAHVIYSAIDPDRPATISNQVIAKTIRGAIGFGGFLVSDDLSMKALSGSLLARAEAALEAGCDAVLHCNGDSVEMEAVVAGARPLDDAAMARLGASRPNPPLKFDRAAALARLDSLLAMGAAA